MLRRMLNARTALSWTLAATIPLSAHGQSVGEINIAAQDMVDALAALEATAGVQIVGADELINGSTSKAVAGATAPKQALEMMLADPNLFVEELDDGTLVIKQASPNETVTQGTIETEPFDIGSIVVFQTNRSETPIENIPRAVEIIEQEELRATLNKTTNLSAALNELIPGFSPPVFQNTTRGLTLRGREPLYLLDGIPLSNGQFGVTLQFIDPETIDRIEVLYGPTALYGSGATGGVIQFFTKNPTEDRRLRFGGGITTSLARNSEFDGDSFSYRAVGEARGTVDRFGYVGIASFERNGAQFQSDGQRIAPTRLDDFDDFSLFGKLTYDINSTSRISGLLNYTKSEAVATDFSGSFTSVTGERSSVAVFDPTSYANQPMQEGMYFSLGYFNDDLFGADFSLQVYASSEDLVQIGSDITVVNPAPALFPSFFQTSSEEEAFGLRSDLRFDVSDTFEMNVGVDYRDEKDDSILLVTDPANGAAGFFDGAIRRDQDPSVEIQTAGIFAQGTWEATPELRINGGLRYDHFEYTVAPSTPVFAAPGFRPGGSGNNGGFSFNIGAIYDLTPSTSVFASFAQGFTIPNIQLNSRFVAPGVPVSGSALVEPIVVDSYEIGVRGQISDHTSYNFAAFYAESELGESAQIDPATGFGQVVRAPQRNYGFEFASQTAVTSDLDVVTSVAWNEGENDVNNDGNFNALSSLSVLPLNIRVGANYRVNNQFSVNGTLAYLASRSDAFNDGVDNLPSEDYFTVDIGGNYAFPNDRGVLSVQVTNLFNEFYIPLESTTRTGATSNRRFAAPGRELALNYSIEF